ncbi:MAG: hypothetical protein E6J87_05280, partial [Deltaproteobacteria bacterium]
MAVAFRSAGRAGATFAPSRGGHTRGSVLRRKIGDSSGALGPTLTSAQARADPRIRASVCVRLRSTPRRRAPPLANPEIQIRPLAGVRILAVEQMQAMPFATQLLAHLGAEVVKVEHPLHGESGRDAQPSLRDDDGRDVGATYLRNNLGKKSIGVDLKHPRGVELLKRLVLHYDVIAENFK